MNIKKKSILLAVITILCVSAYIYFTSGTTVYADSLSDNIEEQMSAIDLSELETFFGQFSGRLFGDDFVSYVKAILSGDAQISAASITGYFADIIFNDLFELIPTFFSIIAIAVLCGIVQSVKSTFLSDSVAEVTIFVCLLSVATLLLSEIVSIYNLVENIIKNIAKLTEIMSPIIITLMLAVGGNVSANVYKPAVAALSGGIVNIILYAIMPLIVMMTAFNLVSGFSNSIKLNKFADFAQSAIKWILGLIITVFGFYLGVQGLTSAHYDGISLKAAKYAISNSVPIIGGFLKDGFDIVIASSVLIKNAVGVAVVFGLFYMILSPILRFAIFSLLLKITAALIEPICDIRLANFCVSVEKSVTYFTVALLAVGFMLFFTVMLMVVSANAFI